ncbi:MAG: shikimate kinase [Motilibacteraceae bacterium]
MNLVFLHGGVASGKLTTARALEREVGYPVFHNHLVVDTLTTVFPFGSPAFVELREQFWLSVFGSAAREDRSLIFTFAPEPTVRPGFCDRVSSQVRAHGGEVLFVRLTVSEEEQERRLVDPGRREFHKLADVETLRRLRLRQGSGAAQVEQPPVDLDIDTGSSDAVRSARTIVEAFRLVPEPRSERYPAPPAS